MNVLEKKLLSFFSERTTLQTRYKSVIDTANDPETRQDLQNLYDFDDLCYSYNALKAYYDTSKSTWGSDYRNLLHDFPALIDRVQSKLPMDQILNEVSELMVVRRELQENAKAAGKIASQLVNSAADLAEVQSVINNLQTFTPQTTSDGKHYSQNSPTSRFAPEQPQKVPDAQPQTSPASQFQASAQPSTQLSQITQPSKASDFQKPASQQTEPKAQSVPSNSATTSPEIASPMADQRDPVIVGSSSSPDTNTASKTPTKHAHVSNATASSSTHVAESKLHPQTPTPEPGEIGKNSRIPSLQNYDTSFTKSPVQKPFIRKRPFEETGGRSPQPQIKARTPELGDSSRESSQGPTTQQIPHTDPSLPINVAAQAETVTSAPSAAIDGTQNPESAFSEPSISAPAQTQTGSLMQSMPTAEALREQGRQTDPSPARPNFSAAEDTDMVTINPSYKRPSAEPESSNYGLFTGVKKWSPKYVRCLVEAATYAMEEPEKAIQTAFASTFKIHLPGPAAGTLYAHYGLDGSNYRYANQAFHSVVSDYYENRRKYVTIPWAELRMQYSRKTGTSMEDWEIKGRYDLFILHKDTYGSRGEPARNYVGWVELYNKKRQALLLAKRTTEAELKSKPRVILGADSRRFRTLKPGNEEYYRFWTPDLLKLLVESALVVPPGSATRTRTIMYYMRNRSGIFVMEEDLIERLGQPDMMLAIKKEYESAVRTSSSESISADAHGGLTSLLSIIRCHMRPRSYYEKILKPSVLTDFWDLARSECVLSTVNFVSDINPDTQDMTLKVAKENVGMMLSVRLLLEHSLNVSEATLRPRLIRMMELDLFGDKECRLLNYYLQKPLPARPNPLSQ